MATTNEILIIGDIMLDRYIYGTVDRISPEAPVPVLNCKSEDERIGGAGIVAETLTNLDFSPKIISVVGTDDDGKKIIKLCKTVNIGVEYIEKETERRTTVKTRYVATSPFWQYVLRTDNEQTNQISEKTQQALKQIIPTVVKNSKCIIISDYRKGVMTHKLIKTVLNEVKKQKKIVIVDTKGPVLDYLGASIVAPNRKELFENFGQKYTKEILIINELAKKLADTMKCNIVVKLGEDGVLLINNKKEIVFPSEAKKIVNVSGAGDIFIATMAAALAKKKNIINAVKIANKAAGIAIGKTTPSITLDELNEKGNIF